MMRLGLATHKHEQWLLTLMGPWGSCTTHALNPHWLHGYHAALHHWHQSLILARFRPHNFCELNNKKYHRRASISQFYRTAIRYASLPFLLACCLPFIRGKKEGARR